MHARYTLKQPFIDLFHDYLSFTHFPLPWPTDKLPHYHPDESLDNQHCQEVQGTDLPRQHTGHDQEHGGLEDKDGP